MSKDVAGSVCYHCRAIYPGISNQIDGQPEQREGPYAKRLTGAHVHACTSHPRRPDCVLPALFFGPSLPIRVY